MKHRTCLPALLCALLAASVTRADIGWPVKFTDASSKDLAALHETLLAQRLDGVKGVPVQNAVWKTDAIELHMKSGAIFVEPPVQGAPVGAFFVGEATATFTPVADEQRRRLTFWFGKPSLDEEPVTSAYFFTLRGSDLLAQIGVTGAPSVPLEAADAYLDAKQAMRRRGVDTVEAYLNRDGRAKGTALTVLAAPGIRTTEGSKGALVMLRYDPTQQEETGIEVYGHSTLASKVQAQYLFHTLVEQQAAQPAYRPQATDVSYGIDLTLGMTMDSAEQTTAVALKPATGDRAVHFRLTANLQVESVRGADGKDLPFLQWKRASDGIFLDESLLVSVGEASGPAEIRVKSSGGLFEPFGDAFYLVDEDDWYPRLDDARSAMYDVKIALPYERQAVAPGKLVEDKSDSDKRHYRFQTTRGQKMSSMYIGNFQSKSGDADGTKVEVYVDKHEKNLGYALVEMQNILKVYDRIYYPLKLDTLRVASAPVDHGRGFEGLLLLSSEAGFGGSSSESDLFRAHEVAHQWWGNEVQPDRWPRDRWLSESFAEYSSMEYFRARYEDAKKTREAISRQWIMPLEKSAHIGTLNLRGAKRNESEAELWSIIDGTENVYTKGPMVLQMFRYLCSVKTGGDDAFWNVLRTFLKDYSGKAATTEDFIAATQKALNTDLRWFWSQWLLRTEIPKIRWTKQVEPKDGKFLLTVEAEQLDTAFTLLIPVYAHFGGDKIASRPLVMTGKTGKLQVMLPQEPNDVTINDNWEALIEVVH